MKRYYMLLAVLISTGPALAQDWYVSESGIGGECTIVQPCASIQAAVNLSAAGDRVLIGEGDYYENLTLTIDKVGVELVGIGRKKPRIIAPDIEPASKYAPARVPAEIIVDIFAPDVALRNLMLLHPATEAARRDIGIFVRPPASNVRLQNLKLERKRSGSQLEPWMPGSRGLLVFRATGARLENSRIKGNYQDHVHLPTSGAQIVGNDIKGATRLGIVVIQENTLSQSVDNYILGNEVEGSQGDGIQVQGDNNVIINNEVEESGGAGILLCGATRIVEQICAAPGENASADNNHVSGNELEDNAVNSVVDNGVGNVVLTNDQQ